jgi:hypothetical protein
MVSVRTCFVLLLMLFTAGMSRATVVQRLSLERLVDKSEFIIHGRIVRSWTAWDQSHKYIWTHHNVEIHDPIKTSGPADIVVSVPGGTLDGIGMQISGTVTLIPGEEVVLFLYRTAGGYLRATGWGQGKYAVVRSRISGQKILRPDLRGVALVEPIGRSKSPRETSLRSLESISLTEFKARIREMVQRSSAGGGQ